jgi:alpha-glucosidase
MLLLTLRGTPTLYYGDEIGMVDVPIAADRVKDPFEKNVPGMGLGRDPCRTPMQWDSSLHAGFTEGDPWLPIAADSAKVNVAAEDRDSASYLCLYRQLLQLRRAHPSLSVGDFEPVVAAGDLLAYVRRTQEQCVLIVLNLGGPACALPFGSIASSARILLSTHLDRRDEVLTGSVALRPDEGVIAALPCGPMNA